MVCPPFMTTKRKQLGEGSSQPTKKPSLDVQKQGSSSQPTIKPSKPSPTVRKQVSPTQQLKRKPEGTLKPNMSITNRGGKHSASSSKGMLLYFTQCFSLCLKLVMLKSIMRLYLRAHSPNCQIISLHSSYLLLQPMFKTYNPYVCNYPLTSLLFPSNTFDITHSRHQYNQ